MFIATLRSLAAAATVAVLAAFASLAHAQAPRPNILVIMGDDLPDLPLMRHCALAAAPADADEMVRQAAHYVCRHSGGDGCVRELIEWILKKAGKWDAILERYLPVEGEMP